MPIVRDTLHRQGVLLTVASRIAWPLVKMLRPDKHDLIDVLFSGRRDLNNDHRTDHLFTLRCGPYDGNKRGLLVLLSRTGSDYIAFTTEPAWGQDVTGALPDLDQVRVSPKTLRPYFTRNNRQFPFTKL
ncbi:hypothetical protein F5984_26235 [Rudanella paleaurantiibacter]|uniref:Uncharacterized protein n=1 Tax=Rudanella paleaurantiibacter TaxID=2614655 RepID=A0A7J5TRR7_9BACT|nr:hypothetical protein [Rudanella paleaurantiibacter]KAB7725382.1 hypothetical protein F5984_26235 [Rudanella paleaurantiibacter]